jgi:hypothetical protein
VADWEGLALLLTEPLRELLLLALLLMLAEELVDTEGLSVLFPLPVEEGDTLPLGEALGAALPLRLPLPLLVALPQPVPLAEGATLPVGEALLRSVLVTDALADAGRDAV